MAKSITTAFSNMYGEGKPLHYTTNKSINNLLRNIPNQNYNYENNVTNAKLEPEAEPSEIPYGMISIIVILVLLFCLIYYFRDQINNLMKTTIKQPDISSNTVSVQKADEANKKVDEVVKQYQNTMIKPKEESSIQTQNKVNQGGVQQLNDKLNTVSAYKQEQSVKENSYCYIGTENGQRECTSVYEGDVCMSGQIFPKMEVCINPHLRN